MTLTDNPFIIGGILNDGLILSFKKPLGPVDLYEPFNTVNPPNVPKPSIGFDSAVGTASYACNSTLAILPNMKSKAALELFFVLTLPRATSSD